MTIGSSPPARGTLPNGVGGSRCLRFIPARAGNTGSLLTLGCTAPVHPRPRGEHECRRNPPVLIAGSSPPARGTQWAWCRRGPGRRFIPARAGNTSRNGSLVRVKTVHPRPRGEHALGPPDTRAVSGSSPPARGTRATPSRPVSPHRFIPARAGNTPSCVQQPCASSVHPRPRGEHILLGSNGVYGSGSSPPARGTPSESQVEWNHLRFIPARAGNTDLQNHSWSIFPVHPRPRGEHNFL